ncbi:MAG TPA: HDIG domain-containing protein [Solirubrobacteraceae bacterium]|nr:HDIG domain-containing protein [Solirubrobacteraceae bacterium]
MSEALAAARIALSGERAWLVGGAVRDRLLGRETGDFDLVVAGDVEAAARALARHGGGTAFPLSQAFGAWRVAGPARTWQADLAGLLGETIEEDLARRDFTVNAIAEPLAGGGLIDPTGGAADLERRVLRMVAPEAFDADPLRVVRLARLGVEAGLEVDAATAGAARDAAPGLERVAGERIFAELRRILAVPEPAAGIAMLDDVGGLAAALPELHALQGVEQSDAHHLDVWGHTLLALDAVAELERAPAEALGERADAVAAVLAEPLADEMTRGQGLRLGALLHDVAKPPTRKVDGSGRVTFLGHDELGAEMARAMLGRLHVSERLRAHVAALARNHLRLGFLVHERPLGARAMYDYLRACSPVEVDVTVLSIADRLATAGRGADTAIAAHLDLAREVMGPALRWRAGGPPRPLLRGDELAAELGIPAGPEVGRLLAELEAAQFAGEVATRDDAVRRARALLRRPAGE